MPVMKAQQYCPGRESAIVMDLSDLEREAGQIVAHARAEAVRLMTEGRAAAERESHRIREAARDAGFKEGLEAGKVQGKQEGHDEAVAAVTVQLKDLTARWSQSLELLHQHMPTHIADTRTDIVKLALKIAERNTHQTALLNRQIAPAILEEALGMVAAARLVNVHANPIEIESLNKYLPDLLAKLRSIEQVKINADASITPGGSILRFGSGEVDARLETQIKRVADELLADQETDVAAPAPPIV